MDNIIKAFGFAKVQLQINFNLRVRGFGVKPKAFIS
jgi:hypothetical protein